MDWIEYEFFYLNKSPQGSQAWKDVRNTLVATASVFNKVRRYIENSGPKPDKTPIEPNEAMKLGTQLEPYLRKWFETSGYLPVSSQIIELGLVVPKFCTRIGASVDGMVIIDGKPCGIIEIKTTAKMYPSISNRSGKQENYILPSHYDQMQGSMACLNMPWCYYILYEHTTNTIHVEKVIKNQEYWDAILYPAIIKYIQSIDTTN